MWSSVARCSRASSARWRISSIVIVYARGSSFPLLNAQNRHRFTQMFVGFTCRLTMKKTRSPFTRRFARAAISPTARRSRVRYSASASASVSRSPASTLSLIRRCSDSIGPALASLLEDPLPGSTLLRKEGEEDREGYTDPLPVVQMDRPAVLLDDGVDDGKPEAGPLRLRGEERVEDVVHHVVGDPASGVAHLEHHAGPLLGKGGACSDREGAASSHRLDGVGDEVPQHLPQLVRIHGDDGEIGEKVDHGRDAHVRELL